MFKKQLRRCAALLLILALLPLSSAFGSEGTAGVSRLTVTFFKSPETSRAFTWYTKASITSSVLEVAATDASGYIGEITRFSGRNGVSSNDPSVRWHKAEAEGLLPGTAYVFRVGDGQDMFSPWGSFKTAKDGPFSFICLTDTQAASKRDADISANTLKVALSTCPDAAFVVHSGDVVDDGLDEGLWELTLDAAAQSLLHITLVPAAGNHERRGEAFWQHFNLNIPQGAVFETGAYYSFTYSGVHFITLNTNEPSGAISNLSDRQISWLEEDAALAMSRGAKGLVINLHKGMYSLGPYANDSHVISKKGQRTLLSPLLEGLGARLVLQGHDHYLSRTYPLSAGAPAETGVTYLNTNTAGVKVYQLNGSLGDDYLANFQFIGKTRPVYTRYQNFAVVTVDEAGGMWGTVYEIDRQKDKSVPYVVDSFFLPPDGQNGPVTVFSDVDYASSNALHITKVAERGIMNGLPGGLFAPDDPVTRAMLVTVLHRLARCPEAEKAPGFSDVQAGQWYWDAVNWAAKEKIVNGYPDGRFGVNDSITREQMAAIVYRFWGVEDISPIELGASPGNVSGYAQRAVSWALKEGVLEYRGGRLDPQGQVSRGDTARVMSRLLDMIE